MTFKDLLPVLHIDPFMERYYEFLGGDRYLMELEPERYEVTDIYPSYEYDAYDPYLSHEKLCVEVRRID